MAEDSIRNSESATKTAENAVAPAHHENLFNEFISSAAYSAIEQPALGVSQFFGSNAQRHVAGFLGAVGIHRSKSEPFMSAGWVAQNLGGAVGMVVPFTLAKLGLGKTGLLGDAAAVDAGLMSQSSALQLSLRESAITGFAYGAVLTPTRRPSSVTGFLEDRFLGGVSSAATFTTLTAGSLGLSRFAESGVAAKTGLGAVLKNPVASGVLAGVPAGLVSGEADSLIRRHKFATTTQLERSVIGMSMVGGIFGLKSVVQPRLAASFNSFTQGVAPSETASVPPESIPNARHTAGDTTTSPTITLLPEEQQLWADLQKVRTLDEFRDMSARIEDGRLETHSYFSDQLAQQAKKWNNDELNAIWSRTLESEPHQAFNIAKHAGPDRMTGAWMQAFPGAESNPVLADGLARSTVHIEPSHQLDALQKLLDLPDPPEFVNMGSSVLAAPNEIPAAKMLLEKGITPQFEMSSTSAREWNDLVFDLTPGEVRSDMLTQLGRKVSGSPPPSPENLNYVFRTAQEKADPSEFKILREMLKNTDANSKPERHATARSTATDSLDANFLGRLLFQNSDWNSADKISQNNPDVVRALLNNSRQSSDADRSAYLSSLLSAEPPVTATQLVDSLTATARESSEQQTAIPYSYGDLKALTEHGVDVTPDEVPAILSTLQQEAVAGMNLERGSPEARVSTSRVLTALTLADSFGKINPEAFQTQFKTPLEKAMADSALPYQRRLAAARVLGALQRGPYDSVQSIRMPELRMTELADLSKDEQTQLRTQAEAALSNRADLEKLLGDGPLGRLMPSVFGFDSEGGIVGRVQHKTHDSTVDVHVLDVSEKVASDPEFKTLLPKEQTNLLWASLLHDVGKRANIVDHDHGWTSTATAWGVLRTLGYPDARIQRITDLMSRDADLSYEPEALNSVRLSDQRAMDDVVSSYRQPEALRMVQILNRSDIKSVKADGSWWKPNVSDELDKVRSMAEDRVGELNKHLLPVLTSQMPDGFSLSEMGDYSVFGHGTRNLPQLLRQRSTVESPEYSMSVSLFTPEHQNLFASDSRSPIVALVDGPFEHISQAHRGNLATGTSVDSNLNVELIRRWATDPRAASLARDAEARLEQLGIPPAKNVAPEQYPRLTQMRRVLAQFDSIDELTEAAGSDNEYVAGARQITNILTTEKDGSPLSGTNEIKLNNPIVSGIGVLRKPGENVYFAGTSPNDLSQLWNKSVPDYITSGPADQAPTGFIIVPNDLVQTARSQDLPLVILNGR